MRRAGRRLLPSEAGLETEAEWRTLPGHIAGQSTAPAETRERAAWGTVT